MILTTGKQWEPKQIDRESWELAYSHVNIEQELLRMNCWLMANPGRRKTEVGMNRFIVSWLSRTTKSTEGTRSRDTSLEFDLNDRSWAN